MIAATADGMKQRRAIRGTGVGRYARVEYRRKTLSIIATQEVNETFVVTGQLQLGGFVVVSGSECFESLGGISS